MRSRYLTTLAVVIAVIIGISVCGCKKKKSEKEDAPLTERQMQAVVPVIKSLAETLDGIASKYPELVRYQKDKVIQESDSKSSHGWVELSHSHNFIAPHAKRAIQPSDFGKDGFYIRFLCKQMPSPQKRAYAMAPPTLTMRNLQLYLWTEVRTGPNASVGLVDEVQSLLQSHVEKLKEIDQKIYRERGLEFKSKNERAVQVGEESSKTIRQIPMPKDVRSSRGFSWFPNSQRIAMQLVQRFDKNDFRSVIAVVELESGKIRILSEPNIKHCNPACAPDGKTIAYIGPMGEHSTIWVMDINGENKKPLVNVRCWHRPVWSPDSKRLVFTERNNDIWAVNADGSGLKQLTSGPGARSRPKWSPDGNLIAFVAHNEIWLMQADGSNQRVLTEIVSKPGYGPIGDWDDFYDWSPDGKKIVCAYRPIPPEGKHVTHDGGIHPYQIWVVNIDGSNKHCVTPEDISCGNPIWAPDKRHILYESIYKWIVTARQTGASYPKRNIWILDLVEKKKQQLTNTRMIKQFALSPDGRKVVFSTEDDKSIFVADW